jgi:hypothetical protein
VQERLDPCDWSRGHLPTRPDHASGESRFASRLHEQPQRGVHDSLLGLAATRAHGVAHQAVIDVDVRAHDVDLYV